MIPDGLNISYDTSDQFSPHGSNLVLLSICLSVCLLTHLPQPPHTFQDEHLLGRPSLGTNKVSPEWSFTGFGVCM